MVATCGFTVRQGELCLPACANPMLKTPRGVNMAEEKYVPRFKTKYNDEVRAKLIEQFGYTNPMTVPQIEKIVDIQLADVRARLAKERMTLAITPAAKQMLAVGGLDPVFGARPLKRLVQREVVDAIAAAIIDGTVREGDQVTVDVDKDGGFTVVCDNTPAATYEVPDAE